MGFLDFLKGPDINRGVAEYRKTSGAVLMDVRTSPEYRQGHIPESINIPLQTIERVAKVIEKESTPIFVCCQSGARSRQAAGALRRMGYKNVTDIGGIALYRGSLK